MNVRVDAIKREDETLLVTVTMPLRKLAEDERSPKVVRDRRRAGEHEPLNIRIPLRAIENRMQIYNLISPVDTVVAIIRENVKSWNAPLDGDQDNEPLALRETDDDHPDATVRGMGGLRRDVDVETSSQILDALEATLSQQS